MQPEYRDCHLLYYTGITRTAKGILAEIVSSMFLNSGKHLSLLAEMKAHAMDMSEAILRGNFETFGNLVGKSWIWKNPLCIVGFCLVVWLLPVDLYPSVRYEGFMLACLAAHQPQQVSLFLRLPLRTPPALPACCLSVFLFL